jgi:two-component sensor histidine kinase
VISLPALAAAHTGLTGPTLEHLQGLVTSWALLADVSFADLLLFAPLEADEGDRSEQKFIVLGQIRPTTSQTLYYEDQVGRVVSATERELVANAYKLGEIVDGEVTADIGERARVQAIPVRFKGHVLAVLTREAAPQIRRKPGELEQVYVELFDRFARMIAAGDFPFTGEHVEPEDAPRVSDGVLVLDANRRVEYASPNAVSTMHRIGIHSHAEGARLDELGFDDDPTQAAFDIRMPVTDEIEKDNVIVLISAIPLVEHEAVTGGVVLIRDVSDLRRRDRLLITKDATIREIHHRVKNNLQTISSLLRLQARRLESPEAKFAVEESVRRIRSIALVHETLSRDPSDDVEFEEILKPLIRMAEELTAPQRIRFRVEGKAGDLDASVVTSLAVVVSELLQNAVDHAFPEDRKDGLVEVLLENDGTELRVVVQDNGTGLPPHARITSVTEEGTLGLAIVKLLVESELGGTIEMRDNNGTRVELHVPLGPGRVARSGA